MIGRPGSAARHDVVIRGGTVYDGSGGPAVEADLAIDGDRITSVARRIGATGRLEIDASGLAVAPGFINILSWAAESLLHDGRSQGDIRQGVTVEIFGEGESMGPLTPASREALIALQGDITYEVPWTTLGEFLDHLVERGISPNVGSFVGATTIRVHEVGWEDRRATPAELEWMKELVRADMRAGALGVGSSLIYTPACFADTAELIALAAAAAETDGLYISHIRNEGEHIVAALAEVTRISREAGARVEVYHLKSAGRRNWPRIEDAITTIEAAQAGGVPITADMYPYPASGTGLDATMPPWVQEGGMDAWIDRLQDPAIRGRVADEMRRPGVGWENELYNAGAEAVMVVGFRTPALQHLTGATITAIAADRGRSPEETIMDLVIEDRSRVSSVYFTQSEDVVRRVAGLPWVSIGSDEGSYAPEGVFLRSQPHPRAYGSFARFLGHLVRDLGVTTLADAIRRITSLPASVLRLDDRGRLARGYVADVVVFDPERIADRATFDAPHQFAVGVEHVLVNGVHTLAAGEHTGARAGRVARGPGWLPGG